jgi:hypothetical protein
MQTLEMVGWKPGLQTVSLIEAANIYCTGSLVAAKREVERLLAGETVVLTFKSEEERTAFRTEAEGFGVTVR